MKRINCNAWSTLADYIYKKDIDHAPKEDCVVYVYLDDIVEFFNECRGSQHKYIIISALSDYGLVYQEEHPVFRDMQKWFKFITVPEEHGYDSMIIPPRCVSEHCKINDKYSIKMHTWTKATFDKIPDNIVEWYSTNCTIEDSRIVHIPFGIPDYTDDIIEDYFVENHGKLDKLYCNFQPNTVTRGELMRILGKLPFCDCVQPKRIDLFLSEMNQYKYVLAPCGNGYDCYRMLETIYAGSIPIMEDGIWTRAYEGLPVIIVDGYHTLDINYFARQRGSIQTMIKKDLSGTRADFDYWEQRIFLGKGLLK